MVLVSCPTEADWYRRWCECTGSAADPAALAALGGAAADRLAWVFVSGYQAAIRHCFPEFRVQGWTCFAAAESDQSTGCTLTEAPGHALLNGTKSWIAGAGSVDQLVISIGQDDTIEFVAVERSAPGVRIELPRSPSFLAEMNQGVAHFERVLIAPDRRLQAPVRRHWFRAAEPLFVLIALNACLAAQARSAGNLAVAVSAEAALTQGCALPGMIEERTHFKAALSSYRESLTRVVSDFERAVLPTAPPELQASWQADGRLLVMFGIAHAPTEAKVR